jgi:hypothetical protein
MVMTTKMTMRHRTSLPTGDEECDEEGDGIPEAVSEAGDTRSRDSESAESADTVLKTRSEQTRKG